MKYRDGQVAHDKQQHQQQNEIVAKDSDPGRMGVWVCLLHGTSGALLPASRGSTQPLLAGDTIPHRNSSH